MQREPADPDVASDLDEAALAAALESRALWRQLCETVGDLQFETDSRGRLTFLAPAEVLGWPAEDLIGHVAGDILSVAGTDTRGIDPFRPPQPIRMRHARLRRRDGGEQVYAISAHPLPTGGARGVGIDVTTMEAMAGAGAADAALAGIASRMREQILPAGAIGVGLCGLCDHLGAEGAAIAIVPMSGELAAETEQAAGHPCAKLHSFGTGWETLASEFDLLIARIGDTGFVKASDGRMLLTLPTHTRLGLPSSLLIWRRPDQPAWSSAECEFARSFTAMLRSTLENEEVQRELTRLARTDMLTGLLTRRSFAEEVARRFTRLDRKGEFATVMSIDLDDFQIINLIYGQEGGDEALRHVAAILRDIVRPTDIVSRTGGDEFAIWLDGADNFAAAERADSMCRQGASVTFEGEIRRLGFSIGLATRAAGSCEDVDNLLHRADLAMNQAKRRGRGIWCASQQEIET